MSQVSRTDTGPRPYINPYLAGALLGIVLFLAFFITGSGLGASGGLNRMVVYVQNIVAPEHIDQVPYLLKMAGGDTNPLDSWIVYLTAGTILGGFLSGLFGRRVKVETNKGPQIGARTRWMMAFLGGILRFGFVIALVLIVAALLFGFWIVLARVVVTLVIDRIGATFRRHLR